MAANMPVQFSPNGEYFACSSADGSLKIWETSTGTLKQEYTPSSHLSATCSCVSWSPASHLEAKKSRRRSRKSVVSDDTHQTLKLIALGTTSGDILLYSVSKAELHSQLIGGHTAGVNGLCWNKDGDVLYSCSNDQQVIEWDVKKSAVKHKWKADKKSVHSLALCHTEKHLLTAGRTIKLWSLDTHETIQTFTGHATEVFALLSVHCAKCGNGDAAASPSATEKNSNMDGSYFFSAALGDRLVNAWQISSSSNSKSATASFALPDEAAQIDFRSPTTPAHTFVLCAVTKSGQINIFEHQLNGRRKEPLQPKRSLRIESKSKQNCIPVLAAFVSNDDERQLVFVYGSFVKLSVEKISLNSVELDTSLVRVDPGRGQVVSKKTEIVKDKTPVTSGEVTILAPGHMLPNKPSIQMNGTSIQDETGPTSKRKRMASMELTIEDRLKAISVDRPTDRSQRQPKSDSLAHLLAQGLQSQDRWLISSVLNHGNLDVIRSTVQQLNLSVIVPLVSELTKRVYKHAQGGLIGVRWIRVILTTHTSYLMSLPELAETVSSLYQLMESRSASFSKLSKLQGKLDLMLSQISTQEAVNDDEEETLEPLLAYQDESSDEEVGMEDFTHEPSESEDNWEELSENGDRAMDDDDDDDDSDSGEHVTSTTATNDNAKRDHSDSDSTSSEDEDEGEDDDEEG